MIKYPSLKCIICMVISLHKLILHECVNDKWFSFLMRKIMIDYSSCEFQRYSVVSKIYRFCFCTILSKTKQLMR